MNMYTQNLKIGDRVKSMYGPETIIEATHLNPEEVGLKYFRVRTQDDAGQKYSIVMLENEHLEIN